MSHPTTVIAERSRSSFLCQPFGANVIGFVLVHRIHATSEEGINISEVPKKVREKKVEEEEEEDEDEEEEEGNRAATMGSETRILRRRR